MLTLSIMLISSKEFLDIQATTEYRFTPKHVRDMIRTHSKKFVGVDVARWGDTDDLGDVSLWMKYQLIMGRC